MPWLEYEELSKKPKISGQALPMAKILIDGLSSINKDPNSKLNGKLTEYIDALNTIKNSSNHKKSENKVRNAINVLKGDPSSNKPGFAEFLESELKDVIDPNKAENKTVFQTLIDDGINNELSKEELTAGLKVFSDFLGMDLEIDKIEKKQEELDKIAPVNEDAVVEDITVFRKKTSGPKNFMKEGQERKNVTGLIEILKAAEESLETKLEAFDQKKQLKIHTSEDENERYEDDKKTYNDLKKYRESLQTLTDKNNPQYNDIIKDGEIKKLKGLQGFLEEGFFETNYKKIIKEASENKDYTTKNKLNPANPDTAEKVKDKFNKGIESFEKTMRFGLDPSKAVNIKEEYKKIQDQRAKERAELERAKNTKFSAAKWIEEYQKVFDKKKIAATRKTLNYPQSVLAKIMAARLIADSDRGYSDKLSRTTISEYDLNKKTQELMKEPGMMADFFKKMKNDPKMLAKAEKAAATGHGGGLDDMFKNYIKTLDAGKLQNDERFDRFMPTVKDRIDYLKKDAAKKLDSNESPYAHAAEILALRNAVKAERKVKASLDHKIPTSGRKIDQDVAKMSNSNFFKSIMDSKGVMPLITKGHGGEMIMEMRNASKVIYQGDDGSLNMEVNAGTYDGRMKMIAEEAKAIKQKLIDSKKDKNADTSGLTNEAKDLIAETMALGEYYDKNKPDANDNIKWRSVNSLKKKIAADNDVENTLFPHTHYNVDDMIAKLDQLGKGAKEFSDSSWQSVKMALDSKMNAAKDVPQNEAPQNEMPKAENNAEKEFNDALNAVNAYVNGQKGRDKSTIVKKNNVL